MPCSIARTLEVVGEWWTLLILRDAFLGVTRFEDWQRRLGIARNVLASRLDGLVDDGVLERREHSRGRRRCRRPSGILRTCSSRWDCSPT